MKSYDRHRACFAGTRIVLRQISPESEPIYDFIVALHKHCKGDYPAIAKDAGLSQDDIDAYLNYAAQFLGNLGNYKSFGDSKFVPRLDPRQLKALATVSKTTLELYDQFKDAIYAGNDVAKLHLGYPSNGHISVRNVRKTGAGCADLNRRITQTLRISPKKRSLVSATSSRASDCCQKIRE